MLCTRGFTQRLDSQTGQQKFPDILNNYDQLLAACFELYKSHNLVSVVLKTSKTCKFSEQGVSNNKRVLLPKISTSIYLPKFRQTNPSPKNNWAAKIRSNLEVPLSLCLSLSQVMWMTVYFAVFVNERNRGLRTAVNRGFRLVMRRFWYFFFGAHSNPGAALFGNPLEIVSTNLDTLTIDFVLLLRVFPASLNIIPETIYHG